MTRKKMALGGAELLEPGSYLVEVVNARSHIPEDPEKTAGVYLTLKVLEGSDTPRLTEVRINCPTDQQLAAYRDGGKAYLRSIDGLRRAFSRAVAAAGTGDDDETYFAVLCDELTGLAFLAKLGHGKGQWSDRQELKAALPAPDTATITVDKEKF